MTVDAVGKMARKQAAAELDLRLLSLQEEVQQRIASDLHDFDLPAFDCRQLEYNAVEARDDG